MAIKLMAHSRTITVHITYLILALISEAQSILTGIWLSGCVEEEVGGDELTLKYCLVAFVSEVYRSHSHVIF